MHTETATNPAPFSGSVTSGFVARIDEDLASLLGPALAATWNLDRGLRRPVIRVARVDGDAIAAVLTTRRQATAAIKIEHVWSAVGVPGSDAALGGLVREVIADAEQRGDVAVKWQADADIRLPDELGFTRLRSPYRSAPGTEGVVGYIRWLRADTHPEPPYYSQTSTFTCGAVTALLALEIRGSGGFGDDDDNRDVEIDFWRQASNYPSCEPIGLAVALREALVDVFLDSDGPVLLESYSGGFDRTFREELQANSLRKAERSDISVRRERVSVGEVAARVGAGELALLLLDLEPMFGFSVPHWVLAHAAAEGVVFIEDPWISTAWSETWVDSHELPIAIEELDRMMAWSDAGYRGVIFLTRA
jgi:hypothetical protein